MLYLLRIGCSSAATFPRSFPSGKASIAYWRKWSRSEQQGVSVLKRALKNQPGAARKKQGRNACSTFLFVDAQSVKNTGTAALKGYDAGKNVLGNQMTHCGRCPRLASCHRGDNSLCDRSQGCAGRDQMLQTQSVSRVQPLLCDSSCVGRLFA